MIGFPRLNVACAGGAIPIASQLELLPRETGRRIRAALRRRVFPMKALRIESRRFSDPFMCQAVALSTGARADPGGGPPQPFIVTFATTTKC